MWPRFRKVLGVNGLYQDRHVARIYSHEGALFLVINSDITGDHRCNELPLLAHYICRSMLTTMRCGIKLKQANTSPLPTVK